MHASNLKVALVGNPNSGKTKLFNLLTGLRYKVGNYPGVTVEKKEGWVDLTDFKILLYDLPGVYALGENAIDEKITFDVLTSTDLNVKPDVIIYVADGTKLERSLFLFEQLKQLNIPIILTVSMTDKLIKRSIHIKSELLSRRLLTPVLMLTNDLKRDQLEIKNTLLKLSTIQPDYVEPEQSTASEIYRRIEHNLKDVVTGGEHNGNTLLNYIDTILMSPVFGLPIFAFVMIVLFQFVFVLSSYPTDLIDLIFTHISTIFKNLIPSTSLFEELLCDGVIPALGSVFLFIPQIFLLFLMLSLLEDSGYLVRATYLMDPIMQRVGLQGRSFIPLLSSFGCAIPGILSTRVIASSRDRLLTILIVPFMSCSARLPVYTLIISAFFSSDLLFGFISVQGLVLFSLYCLGIIGAFSTALVISKIFMKRQPSLFLIEVPEMKVPALKYSLLSAYDKIKIFVTSTGKVIIATSIILWILVRFPSNELDRSFAAIIGGYVEPIFYPLGFSWEVCVALVCSFAAREVFVSSLAMMLNQTDSTEDTLLEVIKNSNILSYPSAIALLVFFVFACQCSSTLVVMYKETQNAKIPIMYFALMFIYAFLAALISYHVVNIFL